MNEISKENSIEKPSHYTQGNIEPIEYMKQNFTPEAFKGFCVGNVIKYVSRTKHRSKTDDLKKAKRYLEILIDYTEGNK